MRKHLQTDDKIMSESGNTTKELKGKTDLKSLFIFILFSAIRMIKNE